MFEIKKNIRAKGIISMVALLALLLIPFNAFANDESLSQPEKGEIQELSENKQIDPETVVINNVADAEGMITAFFSEKNMNIEIGTPEYVEYLTDVLMFEDDDNLKQLDQYEEFKIYASEYLSELNNQEATLEDEGKILLNEAEQNKTIESIEKEALAETFSVNEDIPNDSVVASANAKCYSDSKAVEYARKWAKKKKSAL